MHDFKGMKKPFYIRYDPTAHLFVGGEDAADFLQGQFTNDLRSSGENALTYGLWLNQKGRVLADSYIWQQSENSFCVVSEWSRAAVVRERLETYIIADDVTIDDRTGEHAGWVLGGVGATDWIEQLGFSLPQSNCYATAGSALLFRGRRGGRASWRLHVSRSEVPTWEEKIDRVLGVDCRVESEALDARRIADGVPAIPDELGSADLPNEGGLEPEAISYTKGCYLGQEVMSRLKNLGRVRRRLHVVRGGAENAFPMAASPLFAGDRHVGELRSVRSDVRGWIGLAMLHSDNVKVGQSLRIEGSEVDSISIDAVAEGRAW